MNNTRTKPGESFDNEELRSDSTQKNSGLEGSADCDLENSNKQLALFKSSLESAESFMYCYDIAASRFRFVSDSVFKLTGIGKKEFLNKSLDELVEHAHPDDKENIQGILNKIKRYEYPKNKPIKFEFRWKVHNQYRWFATHLTLISKPDSKNYELYVYAQDITSLKQIEQQLLNTRENMSMLAEQSLAGMLIIQDDKIVYANKALANITGYPTEEVLKWEASSLVNLIDPESKNEIENFLETSPDIIEPRRRQFEVELTKKSGETIWLSVCLGTIKYNGKDALECIFVDITQRKETEQKLKLSESKYKAILEDQTEFINLVTPDRKITFANQACCKYFGIDPKKCIGTDFTEFLPEPDKTKVINHIKQLGPEKPVASIENRVILPDGQVRWNRWTNRVIFDKDNNPVEIHSVGRDVTQEKIAFETLQKSEERFHSLLHSMRDTILLMSDTNREIHFTWLSKDLDKRYGIHPEDMYDISFLRNLIKRSGGRTDSAFRFVIETGQPSRFEERLNLPNGEFFFEISISPLHDSEGNITNIVVICHDITEKKHTQQLTEFRTKFENILTDISTYFINLPSSQFENGVTDALKALGDFFGVDRVYIYEFRDKNMEIINTHQWHNPDLEPISKYFETIDRNNTPWLTTKIRNFEHIQYENIEDMPFEASNFKDILLNANVKSIALIPMIADGKIMGFIGFESIREHKKWPNEIISLVKVAAEIIVNILKRREAELALRKSEQRFRAIFESTQDCILLWDTNNIIQYANNAVLQATRLNRNQVIDAHASKLIDFAPQIYEEWEKRVKKVIKTGKQMHVRDHGFGRNGEYWSDSTLTPLRDNEGNVFAVAILYRNITDKEKIKNELDQYREKITRTEQLASLGILGATVAHELNQPLTVIRLLLQQSIRKMKKNPEESQFILENLDDSLDELENASRIIDRFRVLARKMPRDIIDKIDIKKIMEKILESLHTSASKAGLEVSANGFENLPLVWANIGEMEQVFFILIQNAIQAVEPGEKATLEINASIKGNYLHILFKDTCKGIPEESLNKIFEPFYTTKPESQGTGLGLSIVKQIIRGRGGNIKVESIVGQGTTFTVKIPLEQK